MRVGLLEVRKFRRGKNKRFAYYVIKRGGGRERVRLLKFKFNTKHNEKKKKKKITDCPTRDNPLSARISIFKCNFRSRARYKMNRRCLLAVQRDNQISRHVRQISGYRQNSDEHR